MQLVLVTRAARLNVVLSWERGAWFRGEVGGPVPVWQVETPQSPSLA